MDHQLDQLATSLLASDPSGRGPGWAEFYERACPVLVSWMALHLYGSMRARLDPADLAQDVWIQALASLERYDPSRGSFLQWLAGISRNVIRGALHNMRARGEASGGTSNHERIEAQRDTVSGITARLARDEALNAVIELLRAHDDDDRVLVMTCALEGEPLAEAALRLGISVDAASKRWQRLRARLAASPDVARLLSV